ncbi:MAG TPA: endonuclease domain-containing protein [Rhizomicrobium sp.]|jgi:very-short-patch-repair endonuclease|nr:endonuclease domain-containing protein [Rhizomicrobium sp.]
MFKRSGPDNIKRARQLRGEPTMAEKQLWRKLLDLNRQGFHFRRQAPFRSYILDFVEHGARIVIELDGSQHGLPENQRRDFVRDRLLASEGYRVLRFWNDDVYENIDGVVETIARTLRRPPPGALCAPTSPQRGR